MRLVLSIDGSVLVPELSPQQLEAYADVITTLAEAHEICVVTDVFSDLVESLSVEATP